MFFYGLSSTKESYCVHVDDKVEKQVSSGSKERIQFKKIAESERNKIIPWLYCYDRVFINLHLNINEITPCG